MKKYTWMMFLILGLVMSVYAQDEELAPVTRTIALTNINIVPSPGQLIENGTVLMKDGIITAVGKNVAVPPGARVIKADSMYVYSGFILGMSHVGVKMPKREENPDVDVPGNPPNDIAGITPERKVIEFLEDQKSISDFREVGFTVAQTAPEGGMLPGYASIVLLKGGNVDHMIVKPETALYATFEGARRVYPSTVMGVMAEFRETYRQAEQAKKFIQQYEQQPVGMQRPSYDRTLVAFFPVLERKIPIAYKGSSVLEAQRAILLKEQLGFDLMLTELQQGWDIVQKVKESNAKVLFSLDMPEWKPLEKDTAEEKEMSENEKIHEFLENRKEEFAKKYYGQTALYHQAGVPFAFSATDAKAKDIKENLRKMIEHGLSEEAAIAALTTTPASLLGLSRITGTIENGKMANLVVSTKPYFDEKSKVKYVIIEGNVHKYKTEEVKKSDKKAISKATGTWDFTAETPDGPVTGTLTIVERDGVLSGTITNSLTNEPAELNDVIATGDNLTFNFRTRIGGEEMQVEAVLNIKGKTFQGKMSAPQFEEIPVEGTKEPENK